MSQTVPAHRFGSAIAALALAAASLLFFASPASAHDELVSSDPAADAALDALPAQLVLTFSGVLSTEPGATEVQVTDASGASLVASEPVVQETTVTQALAGEPSGAVRVLWKVVSSDGHPISGEYSFTVTPPAPAPTSTVAPTAAPEPSDTATPTSEPTETSAPVDEGSSAPWPWIIAALIVVGIGGAVAYLLVSRARREKALTEGAASPVEPADPGKTPPADR